MDSSAAGTSLPCSQVKSHLLRYLFSVTQTRSTISRLSKRSTACSPALTIALFDSGLSRIWASASAFSNSKTQSTSVRCTFRKESSSLDAGTVKFGLSCTTLESLIGPSWRLTPRSNHSTSTRTGFSVGHARAKSVRLIWTPVRQNHTKATSLG